MTPTEFPAAHSMDTDWFAIDESGQVARFESGEAGAIPLEAAMGPGPSEASFDYDLLRAFEVGRVIASGRDLFAEAPQDPPPGGDPYRTPGGKPRAPIRPTNFPARLVLIVDGDAAVSHDRLIAVRTQSPQIYLTDQPIKRAEWPALEGIAGLRDAFSTDALWELLDGEDADGFYYFANENYEAPGAYQRRVAPPRPMHADELPPLLKTEFSKVRLPVKFADTPALQLADFMKDEQAAIWGDVTLRGEPVAAPEPTRTMVRRPRAAGFAAVAIVSMLLVLVLLRAC